MYFNFCLEACGDLILQAYENGTLQRILGDVKDAETYDYDLIVIGGGSGGLACSKV